MKNGSASKGFDHRLAAGALLTFMLAALVVLAAPVASEVLLDQSGRLEKSDARLADDSHYDEYTLTVRAGDRLVVTLESSDFDPYLKVILPDGREETNDDISEENRNCRVEVSITSSGTIKIIANSYEAGKTGAYRLHAERAGVSPPATSASGSRQGGSRASTAPPIRSNTDALPDNAWVTGRLQAGDRTHSDGSLLDQYTFEGRRGERVTIRLESTDFDPYLFLTGPGDYKESNDDADGVNSRLSVTLPAAGRYEVIVNTFGEGAKTGAYRLRLERGGDDRPSSGAPSATPIRIGATIRGRLESGDRTHSDGSYMDYYTFQGRSGQVVTARLESSDFDAYLFLTGPDGFKESNDDADGTNSRITARLPVAGEYRFIVNSFESGPHPGAYTISSVEGDDPSSPSTSGSGVARGQAITLGREVAGRLADGDETLSSGEYRDIFTLSLARGQAVAVDLSSGDFDPYLFVRGPGNFSEDNDDYQGNSNQSRIEFSAPEAGTYRIAVTSYKPREAGAYRLLVSDPGAARPTPAPSATSATATRLARGQAVAGSLGAGSTRLSSGENSVSYLYRGTAGERLTITMSSTEVDPYLFIRGPESFSQDNDDADQSTRDARLEVTLPRTGDYTIYATTYQAGEAGAYRLALEAAGSAPPVASPTPTTPGPSTPIPTTVRPSRDGKVFGIFVGISNYASDDILPFCADDARKLAQALRTAGVSTTADQRILLERDATRANVRRAFAEIGPRVGPNDLFIVFYSGHGSQTEDMPNSPERDRREESLSLFDGELQDDEFGRLLAGVRSRMAVVALDSCFSGGFRDALTRPEQLGIFSSEEDLTSAVAMKFSAGGFLSHFLHSGLLGAADENRDNRISVGEICEYLYRQYDRDARGVETRTLEGAKSFQHLVVDRGGVKVSDMILSLSGVPSNLKVAPAAR